MIIIGKSPTSISGVPSFASVDATANVLAATSPSPPPIACPFTLATTGLSLLREREQEVRVVALVRERSAAPRRRVICAKSPPAQNAFPSPVRTTTRTSSAARASSSAQSSSFVMCGPMALRRSG